MSPFNSKFRQEIEEAKAKLPLPELCKRLGVELVGNKGHVPWREDKKPSLSVFRPSKSLGNQWKWKDWGRNEGGDEIDFLVKFHSIPKSEAIREFKSLAGGGR